MYLKKGLLSFPAHEIEKGANALFFVLNSIGLE